MSAAVQQFHQWSVPFHQWLTCEAYIGHCPQFTGNNNRARQPSVEEQLARAVATLHRRTEEQDFAAQEVYVSVVPAGFRLSVGRPQGSDNNPQQRSTRIFETKSIARCTANHHPCPRIFVLVCENLENPEGTGGLECHGILCHNAQDAVRLAHTLANAFQYAYQLAVKDGQIPLPLIHGNALQPLPYRPIPHPEEFAELPLTDLSRLPMPPIQRPGSASARGQEVTRTFAGDFTVAMPIAPPPYQSRPNSVMSVSARRVTSPTFGSSDGMPLLD